MLHVNQGRYSLGLMSKPTAAKTARTSQRVALLRIAGLEATIAAIGDRDPARVAELRAQVWAVREIAGLR